MAPNEFLNTVRYRSLRFAFCLPLSKALYLNKRRLWMKPDSIEWFTQAIRSLPPDEPVTNRQHGYNNYTTQKDHWLGWLNPNSGTGTYPRKSGPDRNARYVYNHVVEPKMLLWLISAAGVSQELVQIAKKAADDKSPLASKSAAIRKIVPWSEVAFALSKQV